MDESDRSGRYASDTERVVVGTAPRVSTRVSPVTVTKGVARSFFRRGSSVPSWIGLGCLVIFATAANAQYSMQSDSTPRFEWRGRVETDYRNEFATKSDAGDEFDAWRVGVAGEFGGPINESILLDFRARYSYASYDFNLDNGTPLTYGSTALPRDPWNSLNTIDLVPSATILVGSQVAVIAAIPIRWAGESGADENGFAGGIAALVEWRVNNAFTIGAGIAVTSALEDDAETFPLISLRWRISESLEFTTEGGWFQGGNAILLWGPSDAVRLSLSAGYERTRFRLDDNGTAADRNGIGEVTTIPIEVGLRFQFIEEAYLDVRAGLGVAGRLRVESDGGRKLYDQEYDPAPRVGFSLTFPFGLSAKRAPENPG